MTSMIAHSIDLRKKKQLHEKTSALKAFTHHMNKASHLTAVCMDNIVYLEWHVACLDDIIIETCTAVLLVHFKVFYCLYYICSNTK